jgi:hypothetical protein
MWSRRASSNVVQGATLSCLATPLTVTDAVIFLGAGSAVMTAVGEQDGTHHAIAIGTFGASWRSGSRVGRYAEEVYVMTYPDESAMR